MRLVTSPQRRCPTGLGRSYIRLTDRASVQFAIGFRAEVDLRPARIPWQLQSQPILLALPLSAGVTTSTTPEEKVYTYYGIDNSNMTMASVPRGTVRADTWTYTDEATFGGRKVKSRVTIKELSPSSHTFRMEMQGPDGKWMPMMESKNTKVK